LFLSGLPEGELVELQEDSTQRYAQHGGLLELCGVFKQLFNGLQTDFRTQNLGFEFYGSGSRPDTYLISL
jgi:hypothetical protein